MSDIPYYMKPLCTNCKHHSHRSYSFPKDFIGNCYLCNETFKAQYDFCKFYDTRPMMVRFMLWIYFLCITLPGRAFTRLFGTKQYWKEVIQENFPTKYTIEVSDKKGMLALAEEEKPAMSSNESYVKRTKGSWVGKIDGISVFSELGVYWFYTNNFKEVTRKHDDRLSALKRAYETQLAYIKYQSA